MIADQPILVVGRYGQVARALEARSSLQSLALECWGRPDLDVCQPDLIEAVLEEVQPRLIVNAAAYTAVDQAESEAELAFAVNSEGPGNLARAAARMKVPIIHISTDYVFDGTKTRPYQETDPTAPLGVYGRSKLEGEQQVAAGNPDHIILRTAWVYSPFGKNFVKTMLRVAEGRDELSVVHDQVGNPTSAFDIAEGILELASQIVERRGLRDPGIYHMTGAGHASWAEFAEHVFAVSAPLGGPAARVRRITTADYPTPTRRPQNSRLDGARLLQAFGIKLPQWQASADACVQRLIREKGWNT